jgi:hypothetical protein
LLMTGLIPRVIAMAIDMSARAVSILPTFGGDVVARYQAPAARLSLARRPPPVGCPPA